MLVSVITTRGPSPIVVDVQTEDTTIARRVAYRWVYYGDTQANDADTEFPVTEAELDEYTMVLTPVRTLQPT